MYVIFTFCLTVTMFEFFGVCLKHTIYERVRVVVHRLVVVHKQFNTYTKL